MNAIVWQPPHPDKTRMAQFMHFVSQQYQVTLAHYHELHQWSVQNPADFWSSLCDFFQLSFSTPPTQILAPEQPMIDARWFAGATFNFAEQLLSHQGPRPALIGITELGQRQVFSFDELRHAVKACAANLHRMGVRSGDRVAAIMPNVPQTVIAMLATTTLGAIWSSCSPDFGASALLSRFSQIEPKILIACNGYTYQGKTHDILQKIQEINASLPSLTHQIIYPFLDNKTLNIPSGWVLWEDIVCYPTSTDRQATEDHSAPYPFAHPLYLLYSSGTTGQPKCILHSAGGTFLQHIKELGLHTDLSEKDNLLFYTTCGWMMWNWMVSALALGTTLTLYEGSPTHPHLEYLFQVIEQEKVTVLGTGAKFIATLEKMQAHPASHYALAHLRCILTTGSPLLPHHYDFVYDAIKTDLQLSSISGGTDIVSCFALGNPMLPVRRGELQCIGLGMAVEIYDEQGHSLPHGRGELVCTKPFPAMPLGFWNDPEKIRYNDAYFAHFPGIWAHGDFAELTPHDGLIIYGRSDAILNPGGVRIGTAEIYQQVEKIPDVVESVVVGQDWQDDVRIILFVKLSDGVVLTEELENQIRRVIRTNASPRHVPAKIIQVRDIPRTINGKLIELAIRHLVNGQPLPPLGALANPDALNDFKDIHSLLST